MKNSTITIELKEGTTTKQADLLMKKMLSVLSQEDVSLIENAFLQSLIASIEQPIDYNGGEAGR